MGFWNDDTNGMIYMAYYNDEKYQCPSVHELVRKLQRMGAIEVTELKDSGDRTKFDTGAQRDMQESKGRMDLLFMRALIEQSIHLEHGAIKYNDRNWEKGMPISVFVSSGLRHIAKATIGMDDEPHFTAAAWNFMAALDTILRIKDGTLPKELYDIPGGLEKCKTHWKP